MKESLFVNCGAYSDRLSALAEQTIEMKRKNGETIFQNDLDQIENTIFEAYQKILSNIGDVENKGDVIARSVNMLELSVNERGGDLTHIVKVAEEVSKIEATKALQEQESNKSVHSEGDIIAASVLAYSITNNELDSEEAKIYYSVQETVDNLLDSNLQERIDSRYDDARKGDEKSAAVLSEIEKITNLIDAKRHLTKRGTQILYGRLMRLASLNDKEANEFIISVANQCKLDITNVNEQGETIVDLEKLQAQFHKVAPNSNKTLEDYRTETDQEAKSLLGQFSTEGGNLKENVVNRRKKEQKFMQKSEKEIFEIFLGNFFKKGDFDSIKRLVLNNPEIAKTVAVELFESEQKPGLTQEQFETYSSKRKVLQDMLALRGRVEKIASVDKAMDAITSKVDMFEIVGTTRTEVRG